MRTRAQISRDAALKRLTRVNHSLAVAALLGVGVMTDVVANAASGHARTITRSAETSGSGRVELLTSPQRSPTRKPRSSRHRAVAHHSSAASRTASSSPVASSSSNSSQNLQGSSAPSSASSSSSSSSTPASSVQPTVVAVSGGS
jgi:hypothetical protein